MKKMNKIVTVYLDSALSEWLDKKALEGYKKAGLIRRILSEYVKSTGGLNAQ